MTEFSCNEFTRHSPESSRTNSYNSGWYLQENLCNKWNKLANKYSIHI